MTDPASALAEIDQILGSPNLPSTLETLAHWALFRDPLLPIPPPCEIAPGHEEVVTRNVQVFTVAYFALVALLRSNPYRHGTLTPHDFQKATNLFIQAAAVGALEDDADYRAALTRIQFQQLALQREWFVGLDRALFIFDASQGQWEYDLAARVEDAVGMAYSAVIESCFALHFAMQQMGKSRMPCSFTVEELRARWLSEMPLGNLEALLPLISQSQADYEKVASSVVQPGNQQRLYRFNPLWNRPLIQIGPRFYAPVPSLLPIWAIDGILYNLSHTAKTRDDASVFFDALGHAFEDYVGALLCRHGLEHHRDDPIATPKGEIRPCDYRLLEGEVCLLLECKTRRASVGHRFADPDAMNKDYEVAVVQGLRQTMRTEKLVREGVIWPGPRPWLATADSCFHAIITMDEFCGSNEIPARTAVFGALERTVPYQVLSGRDLVLLLANLGDDRLAGILREGDAQAGYQPVSYVSYVYNRAIETGTPHMQDPDREAARAVVGRVIERFGGAPPE